MTVPEILKLDKKFQYSVMTFREAKPADITQIQIVRNLVKENELSDPGRVTNEDSLEFISKRGKGEFGKHNKLL